MAFAGPVAGCDKLAMLVDEIRSRAPDAPPGPWCYRPRHLDDWGLVRASPSDGGDAYPVMSARFRDVDEYERARHRSAGTDPWEAEARYHALCSPDNLLLLAEAAEAYLLSRGGRRSCDAEEGKAEFEDELESGR